YSLFVFFFSSRRRHTRFSRDWSSDVCSSDLRSGNEGRSLGLGIYELPDSLRRVATMVILVVTALSFLVLPQVTFVGDPMKLKDRSEERRVGKECRSRWVTGQ